MTDPNADRGRKLQILAFRILVAGLLIWFVLKSSVRLDQLPEALAAVSPILLLVSFALFLLTKSIAAYRLLFVYRAFGNQHLSYGAILSNAFKGVFFNTTSVMGVGDAYRVHDFRKQGVSLKSAALVVVLDRLLGLTGLGALLVLLNFSIIHAYLWPVVAMGVVLVVAALALKPFIKQWVSAVREKLEDPRKLLAVALLTLLNANVIVLQFYVLSLAVQLSFEGLFFWQRAPAVFIATALPISIGGVGVRELALEWLMGAQASSSVQLLLLGLLQFAIMVLTVIVSFGLVLRGRRESAA